MNLDTENLELQKRRVEVRGERDDREAMRGGSFWAQRINFFVVKKIRSSEPRGPRAIVNFLIFFSSF